MRLWANTAFAVLAFLLALPLNAATEACGAFDFWLGVWVVQDEKGATVGRSEISKLDGPCAIAEDYRSTDGSSGRSLTVYSTGDRRWHRLFANSNGLVVSMKSVSSTGKMVFEGTGIRPDGSVMSMRAAFRPIRDGVDQSLEIREGDRWKTLGTARYRRSPSALQ